ncbi:MAG: phosphodiester glycosidase family protein [Negativicutes bacterium]|nr:phosphodiester glycosidase family protein [Negativicutes bacterium]
MNKFRRYAALFLLILLLAVQTVNAAPAVTVNTMRFSQTPEKIRIVFDVNHLPAYKVALEQQPLQLVITFDGSLGKKAMQQTTFNDAYVNSLKITEVQTGKLQAVIDLKHSVVYKVFTLTGPNRLVVDIIKQYDQKIQHEIAPGLQSLTWFRGRKAGPLAAHILEIDPKAGFMVKPALSNDRVAGLETVKSMAVRSNALAAVNASYFGLNGEIIGLLKMNGQIVSVPGLARTALGILPDGSMVFDCVDYNGHVTLPDGRMVAITGVNCERGQDDLILYNEHYDQRTNTNEYGIEYVISGDKVAAINPKDSLLQPGSVVLSAHGSAGVLAELKVGDTVKITETLGPVYDKAIYAIGAGPALVKNGKVSLTTTTEQFGSDVAGGRAPRTAVGTMKNGHILMVVVDGRQKHSIGMSLAELAAFMHELGAVEAMNFDGGGSSEMVVSGEVINSPSDGRERRVGDALIVVKKADKL